MGRTIFVIRLAALVLGLSEPLGALANQPILRSPCASSWRIQRVAL